MPSVRIEGADKFGKVARVLAEKADGKALKRRLSKVIRDETRPITTEQRGLLAADMPHRGGLAGALETTGRYTTRVSYAAATVTITDSWPGHDMKAINEGSLRHPLFGNRSHWYSQAVTPGLLSGPVERRRRPIELAIVRDLDSLAEEIARET